MTRYLAAFLLIASSGQLFAECPSGLYVYKADVTEVYDADTITADIDLGFHTWRKDEKLRLYGIDAPEVRGKSRPQGLLSRDWLRGQIQGNPDSNNQVQG